MWGDPDWVGDGVNQDFMKNQNIAKSTGSSQSQAEKVISLTVIDTS